LDFFHHFKSVKLIDISLFGIDLSISNAVVSLWIASALIVIVLWVTTRKLSLVPGKMQNFAEIIIDFLYNYLLDVFVEKKEKDYWAAFILTLFLLILTLNLVSLVPGMYAVTANINMTAALALMVFFVFQLWGIKKRGIWGYLNTFFPKDIFWPAYILLFPIEVLSHLARPFSLAVRLFANVFAGHMVGIMFLGAIFIFRSFWIVPFSVSAFAIISIFEIFVGLVQAYIFAYLSSIYIAFATSEEH
jgi:F-type H+-transporting ATPase subunit a